MRVGGVRPPAPHEKAYEGAAFENHDCCWAARQEDVENNRRQRPERHLGESTHERIDPEKRVRGLSQPQNDGGGADCGGREGTLNEQAMAENGLRPAAACHKRTEWNRSGQAELVPSAAFRHHPPDTRDDNRSSRASEDEQSTVHDIDSYRSTD